MNSVPRRSAWLKPSTKRLKARTTSSSKPAPEPARHLPTCCLRWRMVEDPGFNGHQDAAGPDLLQRYSPPRKAPGKTGPCRLPERPKQLPLQTKAETAKPKACSRRENFARFSRLWTGHRKPRPVTVPNSERSVTIPSSGRASTLVAIDVWVRSAKITIDAS